MPETSAMTEAEVYERLTKDGGSFDEIKKNAEMLRQHFATEAERVAHALALLEPHYKDQHEAETQRILQENNDVLSRVMRQIASTSPQQLPLPKVAINKASDTVQVPKNQAKALLALPIILFSALVLALFYAFVITFVIVLFFCIGVLINSYVPIIATDYSFTQTSGFRSTLLICTCTLYLGCYIYSVIYGYNKIRSGQSVWATFFELGIEPFARFAGSGKD